MTMRKNNDKKQKKKDSLATLSHPVFAAAVAERVISPDSDVSRTTRRTHTDT